MHNLLSNYIHSFTGLLFCHIENCLHWLLREMGGTQSLMGLNVFIYCLFGIFLLLISAKIFGKMGHPNVLIIGLVVYFIRLFGYSYIRNPYLSLIYELMESITNALMLTSIMVYSIQLSTPTTLTTVQGLIGAAYFGMGRGMDTFVGSFIVEWLGAADFEDKTYGVRASFRVLGVTALGMASLYLLFNLFYIRPRNNKVMKKQNSIPLLVQNRDNENPQLNNDATV